MPRHDGTVSPANGNGAADEVTAPTQVSDISPNGTPPAGEGLPTADATDDPGVATTDDFDNLSDVASDPDSLESDDYDEETVARAVKFVRSQSLQRVRGRCERSCVQLALPALPPQLLLWLHVVFASHLLKWSASGGALLCSWYTLRCLRSLLQLWVATLSLRATACKDCCGDSCNGSTPTPATTCSTRRLEQPRTCDPTPPAKPPCSRVPRAGCLPVRLPVRVCRPHTC